MPPPVVKVSLHAHLRRMTMEHEQDLAEGQDDVPHGSGLPSRLNFESRLSAALWEETTHA